MSAEGQVLRLLPLKSLLTGEPFVYGSGGSNGQSQPSGLSAQEQGQLNKHEEVLVGG